MGERDGDGEDLPQHTPPHAKPLTTVMRGQPCNLQRRILTEMIALLAVALLNGPHFYTVIDESKISDKASLP